jgi:protein-arginine kinase activator protein McsA
MEKQLILDQIQTKSLREVATHFRVSYTNLRYWVKKHEIELPKYHSACASCSTSFSQRRGNPRKLCDECFSKFTSVANMNRTKSVRQSSLRRKAYIVRKLGGKCSVCGYDKNTSALEFHHIDPTKKKFMVNAKTLSDKTLTEIDNELEKCKLLCRNCHAETHHPTCSSWKDFPDYW